MTSLEVGELSHVILMSSLQLEIFCDSLILLLVSQRHLSGS